MDAHQDDKPTSPQQSVFKTERSNNRATCDSWAHYAEHRRHVTQLVLDSACKVSCERQPALCVLGAGNVNDLDLGAIVERFRVICLVDLDPIATRRGLGKQTMDAVSRATKELLSSRVRILAPADVTGVAHLLHAGARDRSQQGSSKDLTQRVIRRLAEISPLQRQSRLGTFDVVASTCMLSQLVRQANDAFGATSQSTRTISHKMVVNHLQLALATNAPGGQTLLITNFAGTSTGMPEIATASEEAEVNELARSAIRENRCYLHLSPPELAREAKGLQTERYVASTSTSSFWRWKLSQEQQYLCYALQIARSSFRIGSSEQTAEERLAARLRTFSANTGVAFRAMNANDKGTS